MRKEELLPTGTVRLATALTNTFLAKTETLSLTPLKIIWTKSRLQRLLELSGRQQIEG